jgi:phosphoribosyl 1,2-cyclic phosphodiesterase
LLRFASLASGSKGNCLVAEAGGTRVLIDCGLNLTDAERRLARLGLAPCDIAAVLVTHEHSDHSGGVFDFAAAHNVPVYLTYGTMLALRAEGKLTEGVRTGIIDARQAFAAGGMQITAFTVPHDAREPVQYVLSDGDKRLGVLTDIGAPTAHVEQTLGRLDGLVLECNYDRDMLWNGTYPKWLKERIAGPFGHLDNADSGMLLAALDCTKLQHLVGAHLSEQNNRPELARAALAAAMRCEESWIGLATQAEGFGWRDLL